MTEIELIQSFTAIASDLGVIALLLWFLTKEGQRADMAWSFIAEDWKRQREEEREKNGVKG